MVIPCHFPHHLWRHRPSPLHRKLRQLSSLQPPTPHLSPLLAPATHSQLLTIPNRLLYRPTRPRGQPTSRRSIFPFPSFHAPPHQPFPDRPSWHQAHLRRLVRCQHVGLNAHRWSKQRHLITTQFHTHRHDPTHFPTQPLRGLFQHLYRHWRIHRIPNTESQP